MANARDLDPASFDAVIVATPNFTHCALLELVVPWRKHLLVEKPLCTTVEDCREVRACIKALVAAMDRATGRVC